METTFEDGYLLFPWGRGNVWYEGIGETDVWESISALNELVKVDSTKKYLMGFSMGGYGVWYIGHRSANYWAALGIFAGAMTYYSGYKIFNESAALKMKDVPVYIVCGNNDGLLSDNKKAYAYLKKVGNQNIFFTTFSGGHETSVENWRNMYNWIRQWSTENVSVVDENDFPNEYCLYQNYPNPFNPQTVIKYNIPKRCIVEIKIFDILGRELKTLVNEELSAGNYETKFDGSNLSSGIYFYRIIAGEYVKTNKMILLK